MGLMNQVVYQGRIYGEGAGRARGGGGGGGGGGLK